MTEQQSYEDPLPKCLACLQRLGANGGPVTLPCGHNTCKGCLTEAEQTGPRCAKCQADAGGSLLSVNLDLEDVLELVQALPQNDKARNRLSKSAEQARQKLQTVRTARGQAEQEEKAAHEAKMQDMKRIAAERKKANKARRESEQEVKSKAEQHLATLLEEKKQLEAALLAAEDVKIQAEEQLKANVNAQSKDGTAVIRHGDDQAEADLQAVQEAACKAENQLKAQLKAAQEAAIKAEAHLKSDREAAIKAENQLRAQLKVAEEAATKAEELLAAEHGLRKQAEEAWEVKRSTESLAGNASAEIAQKKIDSLTGQLQETHANAVKVDEHLKAEKIARSAVEEQLQAAQAAADKAKELLKNEADMRSKVEAVLKAEQDANSKAMQEAVKSVKQQMEAQLKDAQAAAARAEEQALEGCRKQAEIETQTERTRSGQVEGQLRALLDAALQAEQVLKESLAAEQQHRRKAEEELTDVRSISSTAGRGPDQNGGQRVEKELEAERRERLKVERRLQMEHDASKLYVKKANEEVMREKSLRTKAEELLAAETFAKAKIEEQLQRERAIKSQGFGFPQVPAAAPQGSAASAASGPSWTHASYPPIFAENAHAATNALPLAGTRQDPALEDLQAMLGAMGLDAWDEEALKTEVKQLLEQLQPGTYCEDASLKRAVLDELQMELVRRDPASHVHTSGPNNPSMV